MFSVTTTIAPTPAMRAPRTTRSRTVRPPMLQRPHTPLQAIDRTATPVGPEIQRTTPDGPFCLFLTTHSIGTSLEPPAPVWIQANSNFGQTRNRSGSTGARKSSTIEEPPGGCIQICAASLSSAQLSLFSRPQYFMSSTGLVSETSGCAKLQERL